MAGCPLSGPSLYSRRPQPGQPHDGPGCMCVGAADGRVSSVINFGKPRELCVWAHVWAVESLSYVGPEHRVHAVDRASRGNHNQRSVEIVRRFCRTCRKPRWPGSEEKC
eukprot:805523-Prymnesium_polylepis.3